ncbi:MAG TPA: UDP-N-acetylmuramoyl-L-alanyl-D-glutamate--2,6-diaminopimelate ligase [Hyphomonadaceae bacterium]|jgi:UDP-N-acetylmuramoyl-L-alanyl-D-glutamate--2,6-diaminopimelate ligase|nr:UDP-N-acetylmuramoyl-L-alanyl-D-glutamate--2,6-diaminopimelate ligase [Hyphomonadaceae bacterium]
MKLDKLIPDAPADAGSVEIKGLTADSRKVKPGFLFAALQGVAKDGREYIDGAILSGASAILTDDRAGSWSVPAVLSNEPRLALAKASAAFYPNQPAVVAAVTGTNGKSSTVDFLRQIWAGMGRKAASMGTLGAIGPSGSVDLGHTTPDPVAIHETLDKLAREGVTHLAMEASSHGLSQYRLDAVKLSAGAFTNLTQDHLDYHKDFEDYRRAKMRLFTELLPKGQPAVINADSPELETFQAAAKAAGLKPFTVGWRGRDLRISEALPRGTGQDLVIQWGDDGANERTVHLPLIGEFQALNALCAAGIALSLGDDVNAILDGLGKLNGVHGRLELVGQTAAKAPVFVDYAHTPDGLNVLLRAARPHVRGKLIVVFGCGGDRDATKRPIMGDVARRLADEVIVTDDNPRSEEPAKIRAAIKKGAPDASEIGDRASAIFEGIKRLKAGDALLIAGKGHETGQIVKGVTIPFSDFDVARKALAEEGAA